MGAFHVDARRDEGGMGGVAARKDTCSDAAWLYGSGETAASLVEENVGCYD